jgi:hypothetical protein
MVAQRRWREHEDLFLSHRAGAPATSPKGDKGSHFPPTEETTMKIKSSVKSGGKHLQHNQTLLQA